MNLYSIKKLPFTDAEIVSVPAGMLFSQRNMSKITLNQYNKIRANYKKGQTFRYLLKAYWFLFVNRFIIKPLS
jgi:hypothetical protein